MMMRNQSGREQKSGRSQLSNRKKTKGELLGLMVVVVDIT